MATFVIVGLSVAALGCGTGPTEGRRANESSISAARVERFIATDPELLDLATLAEPVDVFSWSADELDLRPAGGRWSIERDLEVEAGDLDAINVRASGAASVRLLWAEPGEPFELQQSLLQRPRDAVQPTGRGRRHYRFEVRREPTWPGPIGRIRIELQAGPSSKPPQLGIVTGLTYRLSDTALLKLSGQPWKVERGGEVRNALAGLPGIPISRRLDVEEGAQLQFAYSIPSSARWPVTFRVATGSHPGAELFSSTLDPANPADLGWRDATVALPAGTLELHLETVADDAFDPLRDLPAWGHPEVVTTGTSSALPTPNVVLISIDTLRADHLGVYGYGQPTSPQVDAWAARRGATVFRRTVAPAPWTLPSHTSMFTGLDALSHGVNGVERANPALVMLAEILRERGYATTAIVDGGYLDAKFGLAQGFDRFRHSFPNTATSDRFEVAVDDALAWLDRSPGSRPFLLFLHTYAVHAPYRVREPWTAALGGAEAAGTLIAPQALPELAEDGWRSRRWFEITEPIASPGSLSEAEIDRARTLYDTGIAYVDHQLGRLFAQLAGSGLDTNTIVVLTSDHGESLGEHGYAGHGHLYDDNLLIPLVISTPGATRQGDGLREGEVAHVDRQVRLIDLTPTILDLVGLELPAGLDGVSLAPLTRGESAAVPREAFSYTATSNHGASVRVDDRTKYIFADPPWLPSSRREELYDLRRDPAESRNLASSERAIEGLRQTVAARLRATHSGARIRLAAGPQMLSGTIRGPQIHVGSVKTPDLGLEARWTGDQFEFAIVAEASGSLFLEVPDPGSRLDLAGELSVGDREAQAFSIDIAADDLRHAPKALVPSGLSWVLVDSDDPRAKTGLVFSWAGASSRSTADLGVDAELRAQLQALGYVE